MARCYKPHLLLLSSSSKFRYEGPPICWELLNFRFFMLNKLEVPENVAQAMAAKRRSRVDMAYFSWSPILHYLFVCLRTRWKYRGSCILISCWQSPFLTLRNVTYIEIRTQILETISKENAWWKRIRYGSKLWIFAMIEILTPFIGPVSRNPLAQPHCQSYSWRPFNNLPKLFLGGVWE